MSSKNQRERRLKSIILLLFLIIINLFAIIYALKMNIIKYLKKRKDY